MFECAWASYQISLIAGCACAGNAGNVFPSPRVSDPDKHHGTCVTHVPWCMKGSLTSGFPFEIGGGENVPGISGACATCNFTYLVRGPLWSYLLGVDELSNPHTKVICSNLSQTALVKWASCVYWFKTVTRLAWAWALFRETCKCRLHDDGYIR